MAIDPSIIGNVMVPQAPQMPDVNAMMQTRTAGLENVYKIETARQDQAKAEAKAQAEAQENALVQALLPAYTYGIETGDMAGALDLVPPEMQANVQPYVQALEGKPPEQVRAALIGSLSTSKAGQEALAAMQKAAALGVQQGQLAVSQQRLAQDAAAASGGNKVVQWVTNDAGDVSGLDAQGNIVVTQPGIGKKTPATATTAKTASPEAKFKVDETLSELMASYNKLNEEGAMVSTEDSTIGNIIARTTAAFGTTFGRAVGTKAQTERDYIQNLRSDLIRDIKQATGMSSQEINSNFELQSALDALGDPYSQSFETAIRTIAKLSRKYGQGNVGADIKDDRAGGDTNGDGVIDFNDLGD